MIISDTQLSYSWALTHVNRVLSRSCGIHFAVCASQYIVCFVSLPSSIHERCSDHLHLLPLMVSSNFNPTTSFWTFSFQVYATSLPSPSIRRWNLLCAASNFFRVTERGYSSALLSIVDRTSDSYSLILDAKLMCLFFHTGFNLPNTLLALSILIWQSLSQLLLFDKEAAMIANIFNHLDCRASCFNFCVIYQVTWDHGLAVCHVPLDFIFHSFCHHLHPYM